MSTPSASSATSFASITTPSGATPGTSASTPTSPSHGRIHPQSQPSTIQLNRPSQLQLSSHSNAVSQFAPPPQPHPHPHPHPPPSQSHPSMLSVPSSTVTTPTLSHSTPRSRRVSGSPGEPGKGHQVRVCMFTMPQSCVLPVELRPYASLYATPLGYPYFDPRQLQGGGVTTNYRTKPNPLLQYQPGLTFPPAPSQRANPINAYGPYSQMKTQVEYGQFYSMTQPSTPSGLMPYQDISTFSSPSQLSGRSFDPLRRLSYPSFHYHQRRQRRTFENQSGVTGSGLGLSQSLPVTRIPTPQATTGAYTVNPYTGQGDYNPSNMTNVTASQGNVEMSSSHPITPTLPTNSPHPSHPYPRHFTFNERPTTAPNPSYNSNVTPNAATQ